MDGDRPRTLLVTNDYPPRVGGIQRTLEALVKELPPDRVSVFCARRGTGAEAFDAAAPYDGRAPARTVHLADARVRGAGSTRPSHALGAEVVLFGDAYPVGHARAAARRTGTPYLVAAHGFEYWLSVAPGAHALMRYATSEAARVPVMCSEFIARTVRTAVPRDGPGLGAVPGRRRGVRSGPTCRPPTSASGREWAIGRWWSA